MNFIKQRERYERDPEFHTLVDMMYSLLMGGKFTISELKDAAVFAAIKFESEQVRPVFLDQNGNFERR